MNDFFGVKSVCAALEAGPEASEPLVNRTGALMAFPAPPRPVPMYAWCAGTDGCGSTMEYREDIVMDVTCWKLVQGEDSTFAYL